MEVAEVTMWCSFPIILLPQLVTSSYGQFWYE